MSERVEKELAKWNKEYEIPLEDEFNVQTLLELQEEYRNISKESNTTKTREVILHMINNEKGYLRKLNKRREYKNYVIDILVNKEDMSKYYNIFVKILESQIEHTFGTIKQGNMTISLKDGKQIIITDKENNIRGMRINGYINLTSNTKYDEILKSAMAKNN